MGGVWHFKPDAGANAMARAADATYLYYGWWVSKDKDGVPTAASGVQGCGWGWYHDTGRRYRSGDQSQHPWRQRTYVGHAAGKFAMSNRLTAPAARGHFTADATLTAKFDATATGGVSGSIDNFRLNDGSDDPGWSVALNRAPVGRGWGVCFSSG